MADIVDGYNTQLLAALAVQYLGEGAPSAASVAHGTADIHRNDAAAQVYAILTLVQAVTDLKDELAKHALPTPK